MPALVFLRLYITLSKCCKTLTLRKTRQHFASRLQQRMAYNNLQKPLQTLPPVLNNVIAEPIRKYFARQWRYSHPRALTL